MAASGHELAIDDHRMGHAGGSGGWQRALDEGVDRALGDSCPGRTGEAEGEDAKEGEGPEPCAG
ncbi:hypothetical protein PPSIR1_19914 [Plesiocystis pacifica SIR-1]|uniref:Uncharacterized protein n=1 Tax=Plesiocystis pacifica SIR-1 TaxID=391625 RepID=A6GDT5_9BACT|nr:hypothetical protein [Plesiocystis pacifica]EDM75974.1 hypothetical protein PPSIR1_19914 [Plesiocystis pacifica SIR-1]